jgi:hypothetical protein
MTCFRVSHASPAALTDTPAPAPGRLPSKGVAVCTRVQQMIASAPSRPAAARGQEQNVEGGRAAR